MCTRDARVISKRLPQEPAARSARIAPRLAWAILASAIMRLVVPVAAHAGDDAPTVTARGFMLTRSQVSLINPDALLFKVVELDPVRVMSEVNLETSASFSDRLYLYSDVSGLARVAPNGCSPNGDELGCLVVNELYAEWRPIDGLRLLLGRHRASWGNAINFQLIESLNTRPDITEPLALRIGVWMGLVEGTIGDVTGTLFVAPEVTHSGLGLPERADPLYGHLGSRVVWRPQGFDVAAIGYYDYGLGRAEGGLQATTFIFDQLELHAQALAHNRRNIETGSLEKDTCRGIDSIGIPFRDVPDVSAVAGFRYDTSNGGFMGAEYVHNGDGITAPDWATTLTTVSVIKRLCPNAKVAGPDIGKIGRPTPLSSTLLGRNYLLVTAFTPSVMDLGFLEDMSFIGNIQYSLDDESFAVSLRATLTLNQKTQLRAGTLIPIGDPQSQLGVLPFSAFETVELQANF